MGWKLNAFFLTASCLALLTRGLRPENESTADSEARLMEHIVSRTGDTAIVPRGSTSDGIPVIHFGMALIEIDYVSDSGFGYADVCIMAWHRYLWSDSRLSWDPADFGGITVLRVPRSRLWQHDMQLYNRLDVDMEESKNSLAIVYSNGDVLHIPPVRHRFRCPTNGQGNWECRLKIGSWAYDGYQVDFDFYEGRESVDLADFRADLTEFEVVRNEAEKVVRHYPCCEEPYPAMFFTLELSERDRLKK